MFDLVIRGGVVVTPHGTINADIAIENERIAALGPELPSGKSEIDASGMTVMPGLIDIHLHFNEPGRTEWEGAATGSRAFAAGGGTLYFDMPLNSSPCTVGPHEFDAKSKALAAASITDFALWGGIIPGNLNALGDLAECGVVGFKAFMCDSGLPEFPRADDLTLYEGMRAAARLGLPVAVHAESEEITKALARRIAASARHDIPAFLESRPVLAEVEAIHRAGLLARETKCKLHIVHISSGSGVAAALEARSLGADISIETCPHYLMFTDDDLLRTGALLKCTPPLRAASERDELWAAVQRGEVDMFGSDHSPCPPEMKQAEDFFGIWGGIAGVQSTRSALARKGLDPWRLAELTSANPATRFGIRDKGTIETGQHADFEIADPVKSYTVDSSAQHQRHRASPYLGMKLRSVTRQTIRRGQVIWSDGKITATTNGKLVIPQRKMKTRN